MTRRAWRRFAILGLLLVAAYSAATAARFYIRGYFHFLPDYARWTFSARERVTGPTHVFFLFMDHFEPDYNRAKTRAWADRYVALASRHRDADGRPPQQTWFYPAEQDDGPILETLRQLTTSGYGEVELHLHHGFDDEASLSALLDNSIADLQHHGFLKTRTGETRFAFIHGNFGLDNSNGEWLCGVDTEIALLRRFGCFADFTFPSVYLDSQPGIVNSIYAAKDDPGPKSYERRLPLEALTDGRADLMIFEGPIVFAPSLRLRRLFLDLDDGDVHAAMPATARRVDNWVRADVHVPGRPDWVFIKVFAHGISSPAEEEAVLGPSFDETLTYLEHAYNDGRKYVLHYVTAREAYNLVMAAVERKGGEPEQYYDATIPPYESSGSVPRIVTRQGGRPVAAR